MAAIIRFFLRHIPRRTLQRLAPAAVRIMSLACVGRGVECPVCGKKYKRFLSYGYETVRGNALCPGCLSLERHRLMELYLRDRTGFYSSQPMLLHIAPEACFIKRFRKKLGCGYITADLSSPLADVKMDVQAIPFPDNHFDVIFCNHIMEHVDNDRLALSELYRVMKPGGWGLIQAPVDFSRGKTYEDPSIASPEGRREHFGQYDHVRIYGRDYPARLREAGFEVDEDDYVKTLTPEQIRLYALHTGEIIHKVTKPHPCHVI